MKKLILILCTLIMGSLAAKTALITINNNTNREVTIRNIKTTIDELLFVDNIPAHQQRQVYIQLYYHSPLPPATLITIEDRMRNNNYTGMTKPLNENDDKKVFNLTLDKNNKFQLDEVKY